MTLFFYLFKDDKAKRSLRIFLAKCAIIPYLVLKRNISKCVKKQTLSNIKTL